MARGGRDLPGCPVLPLRSTRWGRGAPADPCTGPRAQPGPRNILKSVRPPSAQTPVCHGQDHRFNNERQTWRGPRGRRGDRPSPCRGRPPTTPGNQARATSVSPTRPPALSQHPAGRRPSTVRSPHQGGGSRDPLALLPDKLPSESAGKNLKGFHLTDAGLEAPSTPAQPHSPPGRKLCLPRASVYPEQGGCGVGRGKPLPGPWVSAVTGELTQATLYMESPLASGETWSNEDSVTRPGAPAYAMKTQVPGPGGALGLLMPRSRGLDQATIHAALSRGAGGSQGRR